MKEKEANLLVGLARGGDDDQTVIFSLLRFGSDGSHSKPRERESYAIAYNL